jgi:hemolysin III
MKVLQPIRALSKQMHSSSEERANTISSGIGLIAALIGTPVLFVSARGNGSAGFFLGTMIFIMAMLALYLTSTLYHAWPDTRTKYTLQLLDHCAIFVLIAATYTPFALGPLHGIWGVSMLIVIWAAALFGVTLKALRGTSRHRKLAMSLYLGMGWCVLLIIRPAIMKVPSTVLLWLFCGGIAYTAGVLFFVSKRLRYGHFVWHLFVLAGTTCHFMAVLACAA